MTAGRSGPSGEGAPPAGSLRVLLVSANYRPSVGGIERFVETLGEGLAMRGHRVTVLCCRDGGAPLRELRNGVVVKRLRASQLPRRLLGVPYPVPNPVSLHRVTRSLVAAADVVHAHDALYATSIAAVRRAGAERVASVLTQHVGFVPQSSRALDAAQRAALVGVGSIARGADRVVTLNDAVADWAADQWGLERPTVLPSGVERPVVSADQRLEVRRGLGIGPEEFVALFVGRDVPKKRLDVFLGASDPKAMRLVAVTDRRTVAVDGVVQVPFRPPDEFRRLLASVDAFVLPSEAEGFPLSLQEALLAGLPCVVVPNPGYDTYLRPGDVLEVEPTPASVRSALAGLRSDTALRESLATRAAAAGERSFRLDAFTDAYERLYRELVAERRARPR